jgi:eukaryotic-like serine/threonine-protein kinase
MTAWLQHLARLEEARAMFDEALAIYRAARGDEDLDVAQTHNNIGLVLSKQRKLDDALLHFEEALRIRRKTLGQDHPKVASTLQV